MAVVKNKTTSTSREYWCHIEEVAREVGKWPGWMVNRRRTYHAETQPEAPQVRVRTALAVGAK
jgi:hypothetical protein